MGQIRNVVIRGSNVLLFGFQKERGSSVMKVKLSKRDKYLELNDLFINRVVREIV